MIKHHTNAGSCGNCLGFERTGLSPSSVSLCDLEQVKYILQFSQSMVLLVTRCPPPWSCWALIASPSWLWHLTLNRPPFPSFRFHVNMCCPLWAPALIMKYHSSPSVLDCLHKATKWHRRKCLFKEPLLLIGTGPCGRCWASSNAHFTWTY